MKPLLSVIVPVYKTEAYLEECVDSILNQTYENLEVILVDDGSPDQCGAICDRYAQKDSRVKVIHKENGGLSHARNAGMEVACGSYLMFVDSDDLLPLDAAKALLEIAVLESADLVIGKHLRFMKTVSPNAEETGEYWILSSEEAMRDTLQNGCAAWARIYRRDVHENVCFPIGEINEDEAIVLRLLEKCKSVAKTNKVVYYYRCRQDSITTSAFSVRQMAWPRHCRENLGYIQEHHPELELDAAARYRGSILWALREIALSRDDFEAETRQLRQQLKEYGHLLGSAPYKNKADKLRFWMMRWLPFGLNRWLLRARHRI